MQSPLPQPSMCHNKQFTVHWKLGRKPFFDLCAIYLLLWELQRVMGHSFEVCISVLQTLIDHLLYEKLWLENPCLSFRLTVQEKWHPQCMWEVRGRRGSLWREWETSVSIPFVSIVDVTRFRPGQQSKEAGWSMVPPLPHKSTAF